MEKPNLTLEEAKETIAWVLNQGDGQYILNESFPFITGYSFMACKDRLAEASLPKYNIDWDTRNDITGIILKLGSFDFDTVEEGTEKLAKEINQVPKVYWTRPEEEEKLEAEIQQCFKEFYDKHCSDMGDCSLKGTCLVRWPGGFGLQGCKIRSEEKNPIVEQITKDIDAILK